MTDDYFLKAEAVKVPYRKADLWGYCDLWGTVVIDPVFSSITFFEKGIYTSLDSLYYAVVRKNQIFYIVDVDGNQVFAAYAGIRKLTHLLSGVTAYAVTDLQSGKEGIFFFQPGLHIASCESPGPGVIQETIIKPYHPISEN